MTKCALAKRISLHTAPSHDTTVYLFTDTPTSVCLLFIMTQQNATFWGMGPDVGPMIPKISEYLSGILAMPRYKFHADHADRGSTADFSEARDDGNGIGISWTTRKSFALHFGQISTPAPYHSVLQAGCSSLCSINSVKSTPGNI